MQYIKVIEDENIEEVTPKEMEIYKTFLAKGKKHNIYKQKDVLNLKDIYRRRSKEQKKSVESVFDILPPPANMKLVSKYLKLYRSLKKTSIIKKEDIVDLENMYLKMTETGKKIVSAPHLLIPKPDVSKSNIIRKGFLKINKVTPKEMEIYKTLLANGKKSNIYKQKDILKMQDIYKRMSKEQKSSVKNVSELILPTPKADWVFTYNRLASKVKRSSENKKANLIYLKEIYNKKMNDGERAKVVAPEKLQVPPPSKKILNEKTEFKIELKKTDNKVSLKCIKGCYWKKLSFTLNENQPKIINHKGLNKVNARNTGGNFHFIMMQDGGVFDLKSFKNSKWKGLSSSSEEELNLIITNEKVKTIK